MSNSDNMYRSAFWILVIVLIVFVFGIGLFSWRSSDNLDRIYRAEIEKQIVQLAEDNSLFPFAVEESLRSRREYNDFVKMLTNELVNNIKEKEPLDRRSIETYIRLTVPGDYWEKPDGKLSRADIEKVFFRLNEILEQVNKQVANVQEEQNRDLDRLAIYLTAFLGFTTILGIVFPVFWTWQSSKDLKETVDGLEKKTEKLDSINSKVDDMDFSVKAMGSSISEQKLSFTSLEQHFALERSLNRISRIPAGYLSSGQPGIVLSYIQTQLESLSSQLESLNDKQQGVESIKDIGISLQLLFDELILSRAINKPEIEGIAQKMGPVNELTLHQIRETIEQVVSIIGSQIQNEHLAQN